MGSEVQVLPGPPGVKAEANWGGIAQLGERVLCKHEVIGSSPFTSTKVATDDRRGCSSAGRAHAPQAWGRRFKSDHLHQDCARLKRITFDLFKPNAKSWEVL